MTQKMDFQFHEVDQHQVDTICQDLRATGDTFSYGLAVLLKLCKNIDNRLERIIKNRDLNLNAPPVPDNSHFEKVAINQPTIKFIKAKEVTNKKKSRKVKKKCAKKFQKNRRIHNYSSNASGRFKVTSIQTMGIISCYQYRSPRWLIPPEPPPLSKNSLFLLW
jgi:hypothetical protein